MDSPPAYHPPQSPYVAVPRSSDGDVLRLPVDNAQERLKRKLMEIPTERAVHFTFGFPARSQQIPHFDLLVKQGNQASAITGSIVLISPLPWKEPQPTFAGSHS